MAPLDDETLAELAKLSRRKGAVDRLPPLILLRIVQADDFQCRNCGTRVVAAPRSVVALRARAGEDPLGRYVTTCGECRTALIQARQNQKSRKT